MLANVLLVLVLVAANGFFVAAEFALVKIRLSEVKASVQAGSKPAKLVESIVEHLDAYLSACQLGITLASLGLGWVGEPLVAKSMEPVFDSLGISHEKIHYFAFPVAFATITFLHITLGEQVPKILAIQRYKPTSFAISIPLAIFYKVFRPFIWVLNTSSNAMLRLVGIRVGGAHGGTHTEDELRMILLESAQGGHVSMHERLFMENVLDLEDKLARSCMVPRTAVISVSIQDPIEVQLHTMMESGHTRFPLCDGDLDNIIGMVHVKDAFNHTVGKGAITSLTTIKRPAVFLPETLPLDALLREFQKNRTLMAFLVDEYGVVSGLITLENAIEELVGPIQDEFDDEPPTIRKIGPDRYEVTGTCSLEDVRRKLGLRFEESSAETIGGVVVETLERIPIAGETITIGRHTIAVTAATPKQVLTVVIEKVEPPDKSEITT